jgi:hypothetical protein
MDYDMRNVEQTMKPQFIRLGCNEEVLKDPRKRDLRMLQLSRALKWGKVYRRKVKIQFKSKEGLMHYVDSSICGITNEFVLLNDHIQILNQAIIAIQFYE